MTEILLLKLLHLLLFVYWLGGDLGVFYSSRLLADPQRSPEARQTAATIMLAVDQAPRLCMALMLPTGLHLGWRLGIVDLNPAWVAGAWVLGAAWVTSVLVLHFRHGQAPLVTSLDWWGRIILIGGLGGLAVYSLVGDGPLRTDWIAWKLLIFALLITLGLLIRVQLKPFGPAFGRLVSEGASAEVDQTIAQSLARCRPLVVMIWVGLLINAMLGLHLIGI
ncbi:MAG: hypothetical protein AAGA23_03380 [Pseudomonadota bacterium]